MDGMQVAPIAMRWRVADLAAESLGTIRCPRAGAVTHKAGTPGAVLINLIFPATGRSREHKMNVPSEAEAAGLTVKIVRYYKDIGRIEAPSRSKAGFRCYSDKTKNNTESRLD
jgi:hypothetical protein